MEISYFSKSKNNDTFCVNLFDEPLMEYSHHSIIGHLIPGMTRLPFLWIGVVEIVVVDG